MKEREGREEQEIEREREGKSERDRDRVITCNIYTCNKTPSYLVCVCSNWYSERSAESKVCQFDCSLLVDEQVLWFEVAMEYTS